MTKYILAIVTVTLLLCLTIAVEPPQPKRKRYEPSSSSDNSAERNHYQETISDSVEELNRRTRQKELKHNSLQFKNLSECPPCLVSKRMMLQYAIESFWRNDILNAYACACNHLLSKPEDGFAISIIYSLTQVKFAPISLASRMEPLSKVAPPIKKWEVLGPINVGKLEHDGDSTFVHNEVHPTYDFNALDVGSYILGMYPNATVFSDLASGGTVKWSTMLTNDNGEVLH